MLCKWAMHFTRILHLYTWVYVNGTGEFNVGGSLAMDYSATESIRSYAHFDHLEFFPVKS